jgi:ABC-type nitrate/sulfonate/bicarbonate transport system permease component
VRAAAAAVADERKRLRFGRTAVAHLFTLAALFAWWIYSLFVPDYQLPGPFQVARRMLGFVTSAEDLKQLGFSLFHAMAAIVIAFVLGCALAALAHGVKPLRLAIENRLTPFLNAFSGIGWLFLAILWFGLNHVTVIFAVMLILLPFTIINVGAGLQELDRDLIELGHSLTRSPYRHVRKVVVPLLLPYLFTALRTSFGVSWKVVLTAELFGGDSGVGYMLNVARQEFDTVTIFAIIFFILLFVAAAEIVFFRPIQARLDRRFARA